jgi:hypothetical protein
LVEQVAQIDDFASGKVDQWPWNSRRDLGIKGKDETFRRDMVGVVWRPDESSAAHELSEALKVDCV